MAKNSGIQINAVSTSSRNASALPAIAKLSGGQYFSIENREGQLVNDLTTIQAKPPPATAAAENSVAGWFGDAPVLPLVVAVIVSTVLCLSLVVLRR